MKKMKKMLAGLLALALMLAGLPMFSMEVRAEEPGDFTYKVNEDGNSVTILNYMGDGGAVTIPSEIDGKSVTEIRSYAFFSCSSLVSVSIPASVTSIGDNAFGRCYSLEGISIPANVTSIGKNVFQDCTSMSAIMVDGDNEVYDSRGNCNALIETESNKLIAGCKNTKIPEGVQTIGYNAFYGCSGLTEINIPDSVESIEDYAFYGCSGLASISISSGVTSIGREVFLGCIGLSAITVDGGNEVYDSRGNCNALIETESNKLISGCKNTVIPSDVTSIAAYAFHDCSGMTEISIPGSVADIGAYAFYGCSSLASVSISSGVTSIGAYAFWECRNLTGLSIPASVTSIGMYVFQDCPSMSVITVEEGNEVYDSRDNCNALIETASNKLISGCKNTKIPDSVTSIGANAFSGCSSLTEISIPESVTSIGMYAFEYCSSLTEVSIPGGVEEIRRHTFYGCSGLASVNISSGVTSIGENAFWGCKSLTEVSIPESVTTISYYAFEYCSSLASVSISSGVTSILDKAFWGCSLTEVRLPSSVTCIGSDAFGYSFNGVEWSANKNPDFVIYAESDSEAETYAKNNGFVFEAVSENDIRWADVALSQTSYTYDGQAKEPTVTVTLSGKELVLNTDYTVSYSDNTAAGDAKVTVNGTGIYSGTVEKTYTISVAVITAEAVTLSPTSYTYDGTEKKPTVTVTMNGKKLNSDTDYTVSYSNNTNVGTAAVTVTGKGNYTGTAEKPYTIGKGDIAQAAVALSPTSYTYDGTEKKPSVTVTLSGKTLVLDTDYTVSYSNNTNAGTASVTVEGKGNYTGSKKADFTIVKTTGDQGENPDTSITCKKTVYETAYGAKSLKIDATSKSKLIFTSSSPSIAAVDKNTGTVTIKGTGIATITVKAGNNSVNVTVKVSPKKASLKTVKPVKGKKLTVKWAKDKNASGYQVQVSTDKNFKKNVKKKNVTKTSYTFTKLKAGKKYYVRVRSYKKSGKETLYGAWSSKKQSGKIKK